MVKDVNIKVEHVTRIEGHGNIVVNIKNGNIEKCEWRVPEAPRFFEAMVRGRHYSEVARITSRICGICSVGHTLASAKATEKALGMELSEQSMLLRRILKHGENFDSHVLHVYFLVSPDLLGVPSVFPLAASHTEVVKRALRMKKLGCEWAGLIAGRSTHPTKPIPGGFSAIPSEKQLKDLRQSIIDIVPDAIATYETLLSVAASIPEFERKTEYVALKDDVEYGLYDGKIACLQPDASQQVIDVSDYRKVTNEWISPLSTAKYTKHNMESYMVGALARLNNNYDSLHPEAKKIAEGFGLKPICFNTYMNSIAQFIECIHSAYMAIEYIDKLLTLGIKDEKPAAPTQLNKKEETLKGAASCEVPRGILFHEYEYDKDGFCIHGDCVIPTNQNHANIQQDMERLVPEMLNDDLSEEEMRLKMEMLVRAYDPCISCSTHYLDIEFKK